MKTEIPWENHSFTEEIVCPYCGCTFQDSWEYSPDEEELGDLECQDCERLFQAERRVTVEYITYKIEGEE